MKFLFSILLCLLLVGCQRKVEVSSGESRSAVPPQLDKKDPGERVATIKMLAGRGPDAEEVIPTLMAALDDDDQSVKGFAAVALISFGEKARPALEKKKQALERKQRDKTEELEDSISKGPEKSTAPNPKKAPETWLAPVDMLVYCDPWFAGNIEPMSLQALKDEDPNFRVVGARALGFLEGGRLTPDRKIIQALKAARDDPHEKVRSAAEKALNMMRREEKTKG